MILGLDISSSCTGYGILNDKGLVVDYGQIKPSPKFSHGAKYGFIAYTIRNLLTEYSITNIVIESYFVSQVRGQSTFICAECRGAIKALIAMEFPDIKLMPEISPSSLKKCITGKGRCDKIDLAKVILNKLNIKYTSLTGKGSKCRFVVEGLTYTDDCSDALALAYMYYLTTREGI